MKDEKNGIGLSHAWNGLKILLRTERNFKIHGIIVLLVCLLGSTLRLDATEWAIVIAAIGLVLVAEAFNTVCERLIDYLKPEIHPKAKVIKDISASAVLLASMTALVIGIVLFIPKFMDLL